MPRLWLRIQEATTKLRTGTAARGPPVRKSSQARMVSLPSAGSRICAAANRGRAASGWRCGRGPEVRCSSPGIIPPGRCPPGPCFCPEWRRHPRARLGRNISLPARDSHCEARGARSGTSEPLCPAAQRRPGRWVGAAIGLVGDQRIGGQDQRRHRGGVAERRRADLDRIDHAGGDEVDQAADLASSPVPAGACATRATISRASRPQLAAMQESGSASAPCTSPAPCRESPESRAITGASDDAACSSAVPPPGTTPRRSRRASR